MVSTFERLVRFEDEAGQSRYGEPIISSVHDLDEVVSQGTMEATVWEGSNLFSLAPTTQVVKVKKLLPLLTAEDVPIVKCVGLNYIKHSK